MAKGTTEDLAINTSDSMVASKPSSKPYYPTASLSNLQDVNPEKGDEVVLKGTIKSVTDGELGYSCVVELHEITCDCGGDLGSALDKIAKKKQEDSEDETSEEDAAETDADEEAEDNED